MTVPLERAKSCTAAACIALAVLVLEACEHDQALQTASAQANTVGALIAKPMHARPDAAAVLAFARTFADRPETVRMVRAMSGGAYLLEVIEVAPLV
jgi:hypothetical protein